MNPGARGSRIHPLRHSQRNSTEVEISAAPSSRTQDNRPQQQRERATSLRAIARRFGPAADVVRVESYAPAIPGDGEVLIRMTAATVNPSDLVTISGAYASRTPLPFVPGFEGVGTVERVGEAVTGLAVGDRVLPLGSPGAWQRYKLTEARWCFRPRPELTDEQAATCYINPLTARRMIGEAIVRSEHRHVVINAAGSAIATMLARLLARVGIRPIGLVRGDTDRPTFTGPEWRLVARTNDPAWPEELAKHVAGRGIDVVFDAVGGAQGERLGYMLRPGGTLMHYGLLSGRPLPADLATRRPDLAIRYFRLRDWVHAASHAELQEALNDAGELVLGGAAGTPIQRRYPLTEIGAAIRDSTEHAGDGKVIITP